MKRLMTLIVTSVLILTAAHADEYASEVADSRAVTKEFMQALKADLTRAMQEGGPVNAINVCNLTAPGIASTYSARKGWDIGRTSLKVRNPDNAPDAWELSVLELFEKRKQSAENPGTMEHYEVVDVGGEQVFRYMKAIPTQEMCLACHGTRIDSTVTARLEKLYPEDQAHGFQTGDIRGAFTITRPLSSSRN